MREDTTKSAAPATNDLRARLAAFRKNPSSREQHGELRELLRTAGRPGDVAEINELHAPHERDRQRAVELWNEAAAARLGLKQKERAAHDLEQVLRLDPAHAQAAPALADLLVEQARHAQAADVMEDELAALKAHGEKAPQSKRAELASRRGERHRVLAKLWHEKLGRVDRALNHWQQAWHLEPARTDALEEARAIYASLGDSKMVARLYEAELDMLGERGPSRRRAEIGLALGRISARRGDALEAANHLEIALRLHADSDETREALAEVYASPAFAGKTDRQRRAAELLVVLGQSRLAAGAEDEGIAFLRRALGVYPESRPATEALEQALAAAERWEELDRLYVLELSQMDDAQERVPLLQKRAALYEENLQSRTTLRAILIELAAATPPHGEASQRLRALFREDEDWAALAQHIEAELPALQGDPQRTCAEMLELATIAREHLSDRDRAAALLHHVLLQIDPHNQEALARYGDHFRERRDWRGLADLLAFAVDNARTAGASPGELVRQLEEIAQIAEQRLGDVDRAIKTWHQIKELEPESPKPEEAVRRLESRAKMWASLVGVLEQEAQAAQSPERRAEALRRIAQVYRERQVNPRRAITLYEEVAGIFPDDLGVLKALGELYEREGDEAGLAHTLRRRLDLDMRQMAASGEGSSGRDWPVARRVERLASLRRLASMYEELGNAEGMIHACTGVLDILPGDRDALDRLERALEKSGDAARLEQTLEYHASAATGPAEKAKVLRRLARMAAEASDEVRALERWEEVLKTAPNDTEALEALANLYERYERWEDMARVLERGLTSQRSRAGTQTGVRRAPSQDGIARTGTSQTRANSVIFDPIKRRAQLVRYARVVDDELGDMGRAVRAWEQVRELAPKDRAALQALARLYRDASRWRELVEVLDAQIPLLTDDDPADAAALGLERAWLLEERLGAPAEAVKALEALLRDLAPANMEAHTGLRRLYESHGDFESSVRIAERELYLSEEAADKIARGLEIGRLCRDQLQDPARALQAFERVLLLEGSHDEALTAAADLYARVEDWPNHIRTLERRVEQAAEGAERRELMSRIAQVTAERLGDRRGAFGWYRRAHEHAPSSATLSALRRAAETYELWAELAEVYENERRRLTDEEGEPIDDRAYVSACRELATVSERRLEAPVRALNVLLDAINVHPHDDSLMAEAERIGGEGNERPLWQLVLECLAAGIDGSSRTRRCALHLKRARILDEHLDEPAGAIIELLEAFSWVPEREETRRSLYDLAERTSAWTDVAAVESALLERAPGTPARLRILRRKAAIIEERLKEPVRAFRLHLVAFLLAPEDSETVAHLWRLGRGIGAPYREADKTPRVEPPAAYVQPPEAGRPRPAPARSARSAASGRPVAPMNVESSRPTREPTQELTLGDLGELFEIDEDLGTDNEFADDFIDEEAPSRRDATIQLEIDELEVHEEAARAGSSRGRKPRHPTDRTIELRPEDLMDARGRRGTDGDDQPAAPPPYLPGVGNRPPTPPRRPPPPPQRKGPPLPAMPLRTYESPWEELAAAYEVLPAPNKHAKMRWLFRAAEVWETGAQDIGRAFNTLARALELGVDQAEPRARLQRLAAEHDAWDRLADLYETAAEDAKSGAAAVELLMEVAEIRVRQERPRDSEALYRRVLGMLPDDATARERLEGLYRAEGRWVDLAASLEERTDPRLGVAAPDSERPALLRELADIYQRRLSRTHDAIDSLLRLRDLMPEDVGVLRELGDLYGLVGRWSKVIEMLGRVGEIAGGSSDARDALRRVGEIYERELELPDRAIDAYSQLVAQWPDDAEAYAALDKLLDAHARWNELSDILRRRAGLTRDPEARARLLRRRASILMERLDMAEEAAAALRHARTLTPGAPGLDDALVQALVGAGRERDAAAVLEDRIQALREARGQVADPDASGAVGDLAALMIRLADLRAERLGDVDAARQILEQVLALVPDHPTALAALARLVEDTQDPRAYAEACLREADALTDRDAKVAALMKAGTTLRDRCDDVDGARGAFEAVLAVRPYHPDATWALAGLVAQGGDPMQAAQVLEKRLEDETLEPGEAARILTQLAALARQAGSLAAAERRLIDALEADPAHLPAIIARADLLSEAGRHEDLETFLRATLPGLEGAPAETLAELNRRLALACEELGRDDEAYQILLGADKLHRGHLLVKLALGENRFRAQRWREAALHLSALAMHVDVKHYPAEVAEGLYHAAQAEIRSLRPEKARGLYERALDLKPSYTPALHALAEMAMEQGEHQRAAVLLTRQAEATEEPVERMRLFEALGDLAVDTLRDDAKALVCYQTAVDAAKPLESKHLGLLEKLLQRQEVAGDNRGAARTAELMASFDTDAGLRAARYTAAAENYLAVDDPERAMAAARRAVEADPYHLTAVTVLSELQMEAGAFEDVTAVLGRALSRQEDDDELTAPRKALLWNRLAQARKARGDSKGAATAWERAVAIAGNSDGAMIARRELLEVWKDDAARRDQLLEFRRILAVDSMELKDVVTYARALCVAKHDDGGRAMLELAQVMGHKLNDLDRAFLERRPFYELAADESYRGAVGDAQRVEVILDRSEDLDDEADLLPIILGTMSEAASLLWPDTATSLARAGVTDAVRAAPPSPLAAINMFPRITAALGAPATVLYTSGVAEAPDIQVVCAATPIVVLGPGAQVPPGDGPALTALRFLLGRAAEMIRPGNILAAGLPQADFLALLGSILRVFGPPHLHDVLPSAFQDPEAQSEHDEVLRTTLPVKLRTRMTALLEDATARDIDPDRFFRALDRAADRAGLLVCGDVAVAIANAGAVDGQGQRVARHIITAALGPRYLEARATLGVGVR